MPHDLRIESLEHSSFITTRTYGSRLWFVNNKELEERILAYLAKYQEVYGVVIYHFVLLGNHFHLLADFPRLNRACFMRDFNGMVSKLTRRHVPRFNEGMLWRRYRCQAVCKDSDRLRTFLYGALNPVSSGLVPRLSEYQGYNGCFDAINGISRTFKVVDWRNYRDKKRFNSKLSIKEFTKTYSLTYTRLPGYEKLAQNEYEAFMREAIEERRLEIIQERTKEGKGFAGPDVLAKTEPGTEPHSTKTSSRHSARPLILTRCLETKRAFIDMYFRVRAKFTECYELLKQGAKDVSFPPGTYPPVCLWVAT